MAIADIYGVIQVDMPGLLVTIRNLMNDNNSFSNEPWDVIINPSDEDVDELGRNLRQYNLQVVGPAEEAASIAIFLRDDSGEMVAGISGMQWGAVFELERLWVSESIQKQGAGSRLLQIIEDEAASRECMTIHTNTFSFQAPEFYKKHGYEEFGRFPGYGSEGQYEKVFLRKELS